MQKFMDKQKLAEERATKDLEFSTREAEIKAMEEGNAKAYCFFGDLLKHQ